MICFENSGELDIRAATTLGVNVKEGGSPIGYFGTGLKYAIAVLLRHHQHITIWSGRTRYTFHVERETIRGQSFDCISMCSPKGPAQRLGWTTSLGRNWTLEHAYRELWSNCMDEGGEVRQQGGPTMAYLPDGPPDDVIESHIWPMFGQRGRTSISVEGDEFEKVHLARYDNLLLRPGKLLVDRTSNMEVYLGSNEVVYYKGIAVHRLSRSSIFTYNLTSSFPLTEDRSLSGGSYYLDQEIKAWLSNYAPEELVYDALVAGDERHEGSLSFNVFDQKPKGNFAKAMAKAIKTNPTRINQTALGFFIANKGAEKVEWPPAVLSSSEQGVWEATLAEVAFWGFDYEAHGISVICTEFVGQGCVGRADEKNKIAAITKSLLAQRDELRAALIEEFIHIRWGVADASLPMQNRLISEITRLGLKLDGKWIETLAEATVEAVVLTADPSDEIPF